MSNYKKFKERSPEDTVFEIRRILNGAGLFTTMEWPAGDDIRRRRLLRRADDIGSCIRAVLGKSESSLPE